MAATKEQIREWVDKGYAINATHVIIVCDGYDMDDYPVYVTAADNIRDKVNTFRSNMQKVMEVYSMQRDLDEQMNERVAWHYDIPEQGGETHGGSSGGTESVSGGTTSG